MRFAKKQLWEHDLKSWLLKAKTQAIVQAIEQATADRPVELFNALPREKREDVFNFLESDSQAKIIQSIDNKKALFLMESMEPDDRARLFDALPAELADRFLRRLSAKERRATSLLLRYPLETAGRIMSPFFIALSSQWRVEEALEKIRQAGEEAETLYVLPVVDENMVLKGVVELDKLVLASPEKHIADLMHKDTKSFYVYDDQEKVARFIQSSDRLAVPIVEADHQLVGLVTMDDAMDIMQWEETEDIIRASASEPLRKPYFSVSVLQLMRVRVIWLLVLAVAGTLTVNVLHTFEATLSQEIVLALFVPLLIGIGGNTGAQSATTIVRALAMNHVFNSDFMRVALRETAVGMLLGIVLGFIAYVIIWVFFQQSVALIVALSLIAICSMATFTGSLMPILACVFKLDPAVVSSPLVATFIDAAGLLIYFLIARMVLGI
ncbi:MAG: magnesium transporter [Legionellaceae bacterium]|nr:magnesium transporter [Legionellaceae bacterium]